MVVMRMQNVSKELTELRDADAPQSMNADVQARLYVAKGVRKTGTARQGVGNLIARALNIRDVQIRELRKKV
ncbi:hypothetical protein ENH_00030280 [Eimeria necatrix]|uniref:Uncharacterized protein n=1 Tax=Eimeria necatrix TaxID=51315 RepID=U6MMK1_9EIME|nr:hypothetical protein ENH_00030280 [Eimeria necatrix]CDJ62885.1 hypothetical protein ENH_00030280 [Eimeria necatrix]